MSNLPGEIVPAPRQGLRRRPTEGGTLVYGEGITGCVLNATADRIFELADGRTSIGEMARRLGEPSGIPAVALEPDIQRTIATLQALGLLGPSTVPLARLDIEWSLIAEPGLDHYALEVLRQQLAPRRLRRPRDGSNFLGTIAVGTCYEEFDGRALVSAPSDHPNLRRAEELLERWPAVRAELAALVDLFQPMLDPEKPDDARGLLAGSYSHSAEEMLSTLWSTINCPIMLADNLVHELGHIKLFALGVYKESSLALVVNPPTETFKSPVRPYPRPMSAVLHAAYAFAHVAELEQRVCADPPEWVPREALERRLKSNRRKVGAAIDEVRRHARTDQMGKEFLEGLFAWTDRLLAS